MTNLQFGHLCFTFCRLSTQKGAKKHGQNPVKQRIALRVQAITPAEEEVEVVMELRQLGQVRVAGLGPRSGITTYDGIILQKYFK